MLLNTPHPRRYSSPALRKADRERQITTLNMYTHVGRANNSAEGLDAEKDLWVDRLRGKQGTSSTRKTLYFVSLFYLLP